MGSGKRARVARRAARAAALVPSRLGQRGGRGPKLFGGTIPPALGLLFRAVVTSRFRIGRKRRVGRGWRGAPGCRTSTARAASGRAAGGMAAPPRAERAGPRRGGRT